MVTDRDIVCKELAQDDFDANRAAARDVTTAEIHCCQPELEAGEVGLRLTAVM